MMLPTPRHAGKSQFGHFAPRQQKRRVRKRPPRKRSYQTKPTIALTPVALSSMLSRY